MMKEITRLLCILVASTAIAEPSEPGQRSDDAAHRPSERSTVADGPEVLTDFWSFQPLQRSARPTPESSEWVSRPVDAFVLQRLQENGLQPSPAAERRTWLRRASFDLTGLPPSPASVKRFLQDNAPDAWAKAVDRLLATPHYGERWGRFWLDLARYTDTTASWLKGTGQAWLYRDWVVRAFNEDVPYDRFVRLQLAADLMPDTPSKDLAALGFLGLSPTYWKELRLAPGVIKTVVAEEWDERIDAVSRTFLGLTVSCARCHDHKFDPITMQDYYALAGVFASTQLTDRPLLPPSQAKAVRRAHERVDELQARLKKLKDRESPEAKNLAAQIAEIRAETPHYDAPWGHVVKESSIHVRPAGEDRTKLEYRDGEPRNVPLYGRGNPTNAGQEVPRGFLSVLSDGRRREFDDGSGRRELAEAILDDGRALAARVIVNRIWQQHFGRGLVPTTSNFGTQGERPSHPCLLDDLAARFIRHGWSLKWLHREIVLSSTYRQSSRFDERSHAIDPENRLLWRMNRRRLKVEAWRDAMLAVAGNLDPTLSGPPEPLDSAANVRRTLYGKIDRRDLDVMLRLHDFPEATAHSPRRLPTTTPLQQLFVLNGPFVHRQATALAQRLLGERQETEARIQWAYRLLFSRPPTSHETKLGQEFLDSAGSDTPSSPQRWKDYAQSLLGLNEFLFVD